MKLFHTLKTHSTFQFHLKFQLNLTQTSSKLTLPQKNPGPIPTHHKINAGTKKNRKNEVQGERRKACTPAKQIKNKQNVKSEQQTFRREGRRTELQVAYGGFDQQKS